MAATKHSGVALCAIDTLAGSHAAAHEFRDFLQKAGREASNMRGTGKRQVLLGAKLQLNCCLVSES